MHTLPVLQGHVACTAMHVLSLSELPGLRPFNPAPAATAVHVPSERRAAQQDYTAEEALLSAPAASATATPATSCAAGAILPPAVASAVTQGLSSPPTTAPVDARPVSTALLQSAVTHSPDAYADSSAQAAVVMHSSCRTVKPDSCTACPYTDICGAPADGSSLYAGKISFRIWCSSNRRGPTSCPCRQCHGRHSCEPPGLIWFEA